MILDGIRYAVEIAQVAYSRLFDTLMSWDRAKPQGSQTAFAASIADAWAIIDSIHRFHDLVENLPGLPNAPWRRLLVTGVNEALDLRDSVQHQLGELDGLIENGGQVWGYLSWAEMTDGRYTGQWFMMSPGSYFVGDKWLFIGPRVLPYEVPPGRIRLNAFGRHVYLGRIVALMLSAVGELAKVIANGGVQPRGPAASDRRGVDEVMSGGVEVLMSTRDE
jgi:hypothetical protein